MFEILKRIFGKKEIPSYPNEFAIIDFTEVAKKEGIKDNQNKIIYHYYIDKLGFRQVKKYKYSEAMIYSIKEIYKIPMIDKTKIEEGFPIYGKVELSKVRYKKYK